MYSGVRSGTVVTARAVPPFLMVYLYSELSENVLASFPGPLRRVYDRTSIGIYDTRGYSCTSNYRDDHYRANKTVSRRSLRMRTNGAATPPRWSALPLLNCFLRP